MISKRTAQQGRQKGREGQRKGASCIQVPFKAEPPHNDSLDKEEQYTYTALLDLSLTNA